MQSHSTPLTAAFDPVTPFDGPSLRAHLRGCVAARGRWFKLRCIAEGLHDFLAPRLVTTLAAAACVFGLVNLLL
jgi:hypothetical protein